MTDRTDINPAAGVYDHPKWWDLAFADETEEELQFLRDVMSQRLGQDTASVYEPGCGGGRLVVAAAKAGFEVFACDLNAACVEYTRSLLASGGLSADVALADMTTHVTPRPVDLAICPVNTFRHLLTEADAGAHLEAVARSVRVGGRYVLALHLAPPDTDPEDSEEWEAESEDGHVACRLDVVAFDRHARRERLRFELDITVDGQTRTIAEEFDYRIYLADELRKTVESSGLWRIESVHDFNYDIADDLPLDDELGDTVLVLERV